MHRILKSNTIWVTFIFCVLVFAMFVSQSYAQQRSQRLDLEDLTIKGELLNDGRLSIIGRERLSLQNYVKFRTNYREDMVLELPTPAPSARSR